MKPVILAIFSYEDDAKIEVFDYHDEKFHVVDRGKTTMHGSLNLFSAHLECLIFDLFHDAQKSNLLIYLNRNIQ